MKIIIVSNHFYPDPLPRATRTYELVKEFLKLGNTVELYLPEGEYNFDKLENKDNLFLRIVKTKYHFKLSNNHKNEKNNIIIDNLKKIFRYFFMGKYIFYSKDLSKCLVENLNEGNDLLISIGLPISIHVGTYFGTKDKDIKIKVADYGDPFSCSEEVKKAWYFKILERIILSRFDFITIPSEKSVKYYLPLAKSDKIKIIPQGFEISKIINNYKKNNIITFCYAGAFHKDIREPKEFMNFLEKLNIDFRFIVYPINHSFTLSFLSNYKDTLNKKLIIKDPICRDQCIQEMSKMDFLIYVDNVNTGQVPSKLVDYYISNRPIFYLNQNSFNEKKFMEFLNHNFDNKLDVDISKYDIKDISRKYLNLVK